MSRGHHDCSGHQTTVPSVCQSLDEMDFERGIWSAALNGDVETVRRKLQSGDDPNQVDSSGYTALHYAARNGHYKVCCLLLDYGGRVNPQTRSGGVTPIHRAAYSGHSDITKLLITRGADVMLCDADGKSALHKAAERNHIDIAKLLVSMKPMIVNVRDCRNKLAQDYGLQDFLGS